MIERFEGQNAFLSNFYPSPFIATTWFNYGSEKEYEFPTVEHWFQAHKAANLADFERVLESPTPGIAKRTGKSIQMREEWDAVREDVMRAGLEHKFAPGSELAKKLVATGDEYLQEGNTWGDSYWGATFDTLMLRWDGRNRLGVMLMEVREALREDGRTDG